jgi:predicted HTH transcriptional regulator
LAREISAFANKDGGEIICGVAEVPDDEGGGISVVGCQDDIDSCTSGAGGFDKIDLILGRLFNKYFDNPALVKQHVNIDLVNHESKPLVLISVAPSKRIIFVKGPDKTGLQLNIREGTVAQNVKFNEKENYYTFERISN